MLQKVRMEKLQWFMLPAHWSELKFKFDPRERASFTGIWFLLSQNWLSKFQLSTSVGLRNCFSFPLFQLCFYFVLLPRIYFNRNRWWFICRNRVKLPRCSNEPLVRDFIVEFRNYFWIIFYGSGEQIKLEKNMRDSVSKLNSNVHARKKIIKIMSYKWLWFNTNFYHNFYCPTIFFPSFLYHEIPKAFGKKYLRNSCLDIHATRMT